MRSARALGFDDRGVPFGGQVGDAGLEDARPLRRRCDLGEAREAERVVPGLSHRAGARVLGPGRRALAGEAVVRVEAEEAAVAVDPAVSSSIEDRRPRTRLPGPTATPSPRA